MTVQESANMPYFANEEDEQTMHAIERWRLTAETEVDDIAVWRDVEPNELEFCYWSERPPGCGGIHNSTGSATFFSDTTHLVRRIVNDYQRLDPAPIQEIHAAVAAWHDDHSAVRLPPQPELLALLERAMMVVLTLEADIHRTLREAQGAAEGQSVIAGFAQPVKLTDAAGVINKRSDVILNRLRRAGCATTPRGVRPAYAEHEDLCKMYPRYRDHARGE